MAVPGKKKVIKRKNLGQIPSIMDVPNLIEVQRSSYSKFLQSDVPAEEREDVGLQSAFKSVFPITDFRETSSLEFVSYSFGKPKYSVGECRARGATFGVPLKVSVKLIVCEKEKNNDVKILEVKKQEIYLGDIPLMTEEGTFVINGTERTVVSQMHRSPGVFYRHDKSKLKASGKITSVCRVIPYRGSWIEFELGDDGLLQMRIDKRRKELASVLLRALGYGTDEEILRLFYKSVSITIDENHAPYMVVEEQGGASLKARQAYENPEGDAPLIKEGGKITRVALKKLKAQGIDKIAILSESIKGHVLACDILNVESGEVYAEAGDEVSDETLEKILTESVNDFGILLVEGRDVGTAVIETVRKDVVKNRDDAYIEIYKKMRPGDPPTLDNSKQLFDDIFFNEKRYDLSVVGRLKVNKKLGLNTPLSLLTLQEDDFVAMLAYLAKLHNGHGEVDDIDHLGNRRVRSVGELLENQFRIGLVRMERSVKERMSIQDLQAVLPHDLINAKPVSAVVKEFFGSSQLSQFMDQTNPLAEVTHKRRLSALGPGGLSRERAGFEVRDVHPTHYGRICPIETPEGPNIGLISSLSTYAKVNNFGFIETPYRRVEDGKLTNKVEYLSAIEEMNYSIAQANALVDDDYNFLSSRISARQGGDFVMLSPKQLDYMDVSPKQLVSVSASLIPFLENDDANRALMGSNMQRQAVPLLVSDAPVVGTGMELVVARDSGVVILAKRPGVIERVTSSRVIVRVDPDHVSADEGDPGVDIYEITKFRRSNQNTCINQKPVKFNGDRLEIGDIIADGPATQDGELALGHNVLVAFMPWAGYNFEDAILISEELIKNDRFTSIHIEEFDIECRDTKLGREEITRDIPNVGEDVLKALDESGVIRIGAEIKPGDILVGKVTPKGETQLTPEEKLLRAIFGEKARDVRDASLTVPPGIAGVVVDVKIFTRRGVEKDDRTRAIEESEAVYLKNDYDEKFRVVKDCDNRVIREKLQDKTLASNLYGDGGEVILESGAVLSSDILEPLPDSLLSQMSVSDNGVMLEMEEMLRRQVKQLEVLEKRYDESLERLNKGGELPPGVIKMVKVYVAMKRKLSVGDKMAGRHGNKGVIAKILPAEDMPFLPNGEPVQILLNPLGVPSRMNVGQILETHLGWAAKALGFNTAVPVFDGASEKQVRDMLVEAGLPESGRTELYDGKTGDRFHQKVTVGYIYMLKLAHLVDDKIHARSIGPYSLVTQQPLGGKAQFGGQRFGEMEVWALESYGAAYILQEMLTVKSDDVVGRTKAYEAIVKGDNIPQPGLPESFNVLVKELQSLCFDVDLVEEPGL